MAGVFGLVAAMFLALLLMLLRHESKFGSLDGGQREEGAVEVAEQKKSDPLGGTTDWYSHS